MISLLHNHSTQCADALRHLPVSAEVHAEFDSYFDSGLQPGAAIRLHEDKLLPQEDGLLAIADGSRNPSKRCVYYMYDKWRANHLGSASAPLEMLETKLPLYTEKGNNKLCF